MREADKKYSSQPPAINTQLRVYRVIRNMSRKALSLLGFSRNGKTQNLVEIIRLQNLLIQNLVDENNLREAMNVRLRDECITLLQHNGVTVEGIEGSEMRLH